MHVKAPLSLLPPNLTLPFKFSCVTHRSKIKVNKNKYKYVQVRINELKIRLAKSSLMNWGKKMQLVVMKLIVLKILEICCMQQWMFCRLIVKKL